jgi:hypothetical protein
MSSQQDLNDRIDSDRDRFVLKICRDDYVAIELQARLCPMEPAERNRGRPLFSP